MKLSRSLILSLVLFFCIPAAADGPFRAHRFDAVNVMPVHTGDIVFVGNSITNMHEWWEAFGCRGNILNRGVSGCISSETLANIDPVVKGHPAKIFLMVGTNDLTRDGHEDPQKILGNVESIVSRFRDESPETEIYIQSVLPVSEENSRKAEDIMEVNALYRDFCRREGLTYVDLWSEFVEPGTNHINPAYTKDGLHPYPSGYRVWCNRIAEYVGSECVYPDAPFDDCGIEGSFGMRLAAFGQLPLGEDDIVMLGDEMIHSGEWHELLACDRVKNRGTGWGFGYPGIELVAREVPAIFGSGKSPSKVFIHAGSSEVASNVPADTIEARYRRLVKSVAEASPRSRLVLMAVQPVFQHHQKVTDQEDVNSRISRIAEECGADYLDIYSPLKKGGDKYVRGNYVTGEGYLKISRLVAENIGIDPVPVTVVTRNTAFTGRGNRDEVLTTLTVSPSRRMHLRRMRISLDADASDVTALRVECGGKVLGSARVRSGKKVYSIPCRMTVDDLEDIDVCVDIAEDAKEGNEVSADIVKVRYGLVWKKVMVPESGSREILLRRTRLLSPGDFQSVGFRIPALVSLPDGTLLATADRRKFNDLDLPEDIDIIAQRSSDGGRTWSDPIYVIQGRGYNNGYGDAALAVAPSGQVFCAFSGGTGLWASDLENPQRNYISSSSDGGCTWSEPFDCTSMLWGPDAANPECRTSHSAFFGSGRGLTLTRGEHAGRIIFVAAVHSRELGRFDNYAFYSDDCGASWKVSERAFIGGDEAKVTQLSDGRVLMSVRRHGERGYNISEDGGATWGEQGLWKDICVNACDGDIITLGNGELLHSVPNDMDRRNVSIFISGDNGLSWPYSKSICRYESVYSSIAELPDGTIVAYIEENPNVGFEMWYMNFSMEWLKKKTR